MAALTETCSCGASITAEYSQLSALSTTRARAMIADWRQNHRCKSEHPATAADTTPLSGRQVGPDKRRVSGL